ncbi:MAG TPA: DUF1611 domain-containing protein [Ktedonobacterales bacterium]|nr:DUF1611 domain-containing protein [Ktedonobacterales bacterium]
MRRIAILADGSFGPFSAKTAVGVLRYSPDTVVAVVDSAHAGETAEDVIGSGIGQGVPVVASVADALAFQPDTLLIGIAPIGGKLPDAWRPGILRAIEAGLTIVSGLHVFLGDDPELKQAAEAHNAVLWDVRRPPDDLAQRIREGTPHRAGSHTVYFCGTDCNVGKMTASFELWREARRRNLSAGFAATGQTGIMISGEGIPADRFISDFLSGAVEAMTLDFTERYDWVFVEGQGSLMHPAYSPVTLGLVHGSAPDLLVLCHQAGRTAVHGYEDTPIPSLAKSREIYETAARWLKPASVVAIALNTYLMSEDEAQAALEAAERETGLPASDPVRDGGGALLDALLAHSDRHA